MTSTAACNEVLCMFAGTPKSDNTLEGVTALERATASMRTAKLKVWIVSCLSHYAA